MVLDTLIKKRASVELKELPAVIPSMHSLDRDANILMMAEANDGDQVEQSSKLLDIAKHGVVQIDVGEVTVYFSS